MALFVDVSDGRLVEVLDALADEGRSVVSICPLEMATGRYIRESTYVTIWRIFYR